MSSLVRMNLICKLCVYIYLLVCLYIGDIMYVDIYIYSLKACFSLDNLNNSLKIDFPSPSTLSFSPSLPFG